MPSESGQIRFTVSLDDLIAPVHVGLKVLMLLVGDVLGQAPSTAEVPEGVPGIFFRFDPAPGLRPSRVELTSYVQERILQWATSDAVELIKPLIVGSRALCALYDRGPTSSLTGDEWNVMRESWERAAEKMAKMDLHRRLKEFSRLHPDFKMPPLLPEIQGIFRMRNCLLHNHGVVARSYCNDSETLHIRFRRWSAWVLDSAGDREYKEGEILVSGQSVQMRFVTAERVWKVGERILLSPQLFVDLCVTIDRFAIEMAKALEAYARSRGIPFEPPDSWKTQSSGTPPSDSANGLQERCGEGQPQNQGSYQWNGPSHRYREIRDTSSNRKRVGPLARVGAP